MQSEAKKFSSSQLRQIDDLRKNRDARANSTGGFETQGILKKPGSNGNGQNRDENQSGARNVVTNGMLDNLI